MDERLRFRRSTPRWGEDGRTVPRVRYLPQNRLQDLHPYKDCGIDGLTDRSRRPYRQANPTARSRSRSLIVQLQAGAPQLGRSQDPGEAPPSLTLDISLPGDRTVHAVLDRHGLVPQAVSVCPHAVGTSLARPYQPNDLWCADYKGEFMLADRRYCYPLTITDFASRYLLVLRGPGEHHRGYAFTMFERTFKDFGLPRAIRTDNGVPFASRIAFFGLTQALRVVAPPRHRYRADRRVTLTNGRHERMHLTLKGSHQAGRQNFLQQQAQVRSLPRVLQPRAATSGARHEYPAELYAPSPRPYQGLGELEYPFHDRTITVTNCGRICMADARSTSATSSLDRTSASSEVSEHIWLVCFMRYDLGFFDHETGRVECARKPLRR